MMLRNSVRPVAQRIIDRWRHPEGLPKRAHGDNSSLTAAIDIDAQNVLGDTPISQRK
ncbi:MAG: hypothetical protein LC123_16500 [Burkholderiales bacterium]|jgi:hypothetical protein|nr:hypothetical protein [Pseudorhodoplanes sp.]MCZ2421424.1 hypothetical protein [Burkholderiales bacterium]